MQCFLRSSRQHSISKNPVQFCLNTLGTTLHRSKTCDVMLPERGSRQLCIRKSPVQCCFNTLGITLHSWKPYTMLPEKLQTTLNKKKSCAIPIFFILSKQHCSGQKPMQCCKKGSRQYLIRKNPVQYCLNTIGRTLHNWKPYSILPDPEIWGQRGSRQLCMSKIQCFIQSWSYGMTSQRLQATLWTTSVHPVCICIYQVLYVKKTKLSFLYYENRLKLRLKQQLGILPSNGTRLHIAMDIAYEI